MHPHLIKLLSLSALTVGILAASNGARADEALPPRRRSSAPNRAATCARQPMTRRTTPRVISRTSPRWCRRKATGCSGLRKTCAPSSTPPRPATNACNSCTMRSRQRRRAGDRLSADPWPGEPQQAQPAGKSRVRLRESAGQLQDHARPFRQDGLRGAGPVAADQRIAAGHPARPRFLLPWRPALDAIRRTAHGENRRREGQADPGLRRHSQA